MKRDDVLSTCISVTLTQVPGDTQVREHVLLPLNRVHYWLATISAKRIKCEFQRKAARYSDLIPATVPI